MCYDNKARPPIAPIAGGAERSGDTLLRAADGNEFRAHYATAARRTGAGVLVLPDIRGLHPFYEELADRFVENGIDALAMDYFGRTAGTTPRGDSFEWQPHVAATRADTIRQDVASSLAFLRSPTGGAPSAIFTVGFCFGGAISWTQAANDFGLSGAIGFYGRAVGPTRDGSPAPIDLVSSFSCPILGLFGGADQGIPRTVVDEFNQALDRANVPHELVIYPGAPHSFFDRHQAEFADASADAWRRILDFIQVNARRQPA